jgi:hypothetical protein
MIDVRIVDTEAVMTIRPEDIRRYLRSHAFVPLDKGHKYEHWANDRFRVHVPVKHTYSYASDVLSVIRRMSVFLDCSELEVYFDMGGSLFGAGEAEKELTNLPLDDMDYIAKTRELTKWLMRICGLPAELLEGCGEDDKLD